MVWFVNVWWDDFPLRGGLFGGDENERDGTTAGEILGRPLPSRLEGDLEETRRRVSLNLVWGPA